MTMGDLVTKEEIQKQNTDSDVLHKNKLRNWDMKAELNIYPLKEEIWNYRQKWVTFKNS